jgi:hypothetical protein
MPRPASAEKRVRLNLELSERVRDRLELVRVMSEADTLTEVIRRSLVIYEALLTTMLAGDKIVLRVNGEEKELLFK